MDIRPQKKAQGLARAARNALRHGLNVPIYSDPAMTEELDMLAREIAGAEAHGKRLAKRTH